MRTVVFFDVLQDKVMVMKQRLSKRPNGNAQQRAKAMRSGWKPEWINCERPYPLENYEELNVTPQVVRVDFDDASSLRFDFLMFYEKLSGIEIVPFGTIPEPPEIKAALALSAIYSTPASVL